MQRPRKPPVEMLLCGIIVLVVLLMGGGCQSTRKQYIGETTVTKAIQSAGDFTDFAAKNRIELTRADGNTIRVNYIKAAKDPTLDLSVFPGDKIVVPQRSLWDSFR